MLKLDPTLEVKDALKTLMTTRAKGSMPSVYVVNEQGMTTPSLWCSHPLKGSYLRVSAAGKHGLPKLDALEVLQHLDGEMTSTDEIALRYVVLGIFAARMGLVVVEKNGPQSQAEDGTSISVKLVPPDELTLDELNRHMIWMTRYTVLSPSTFTIFESERVRAYLTQRNERQEK